MKREDSTALSEQEREQLKAHIDLVTSAEAGQLDDLPCPQCKERRVSVWIARPSPEEYRTWFICQKCGFRTRTHDMGRPSYYSPARDLSKKEAVTT